MLLGHSLQVRFLDRNSLLAGIRFGDLAMDKGRSVRLLAIRGSHQPTPGAKRAVWKLTAAFP